MNQDLVKHRYNPVCRYDLALFLQVNAGNNKETTNNKPWNNKYTFLVFYLLFSLYYFDKYFFFRFYDCSFLQYINKVNVGQLKRVCTNVLIDDNDEASDMSLCMRVCVCV